MRRTMIAALLMTAFAVPAVAQGLGGLLKKGEAVKTPESEDTFFRDLIGYSVGTIGIHRLGLFLALSAGFWSAVYIIISGPLYGGSFPEWWEWWRNMPIWS